MTPERALYVYAAVPGDAALDALRGVGDEPVGVLSADGLGLVVSEVTTADLAAVTDESADPRLVGDLAQRHDLVVRAVAASAGATLPFRIGTVVTDRQAAYRFLGSRAAALRSGLTHVAGCDEWGVTVREGGAGQADPDDTPTAESGTAYLMRRRQHFQRLEQRRRAALELVAQTEAALGELAADTVPGRGQQGLLLDRAYLVRRDEQSRFVAALDRCGDRLAADGFVLRVTGPWPPYSFTVADLEVTADE
ncbi:GvpL/GvpF family gas vesicle protein [Planosporangium mesophilum]|uniref:Gas vesicle protein n=1 Tax=Planosporangium mesophilum TaxID=689768 RepID=A0A8J3T4S1_9ACTN|nr:GvpL/GvpF family gas vesicle protein [Planosporangium mesophilum]NJC81809.1 GvpL/GvpF family gas vesicle protein [Planosporangium mesophilum]GII20530.1 gas vesicle protein [Planosporangium mesophilum]